MERSVCNKVCLKATEPLQGSSFACCVDVDKAAFRVKGLYHISSIKGFPNCYGKLKNKGKKNLRYITMYESNPTQKAGKNKQLFIPNTHLVSSNQSSTSMKTSMYTFNTLFLQIIILSFLFCQVTSQAQVRGVFAVQDYSRFIVL